MAINAEYSASPSDEHKRSLDEARFFKAPFHRRLLSRPLQPSYREQQKHQGNIVPNGDSDELEINANVLRKHLTKFLATAAVARASSASRFGHSAYRQQQQQQQQEQQQPLNNALSAVFDAYVNETPDLGLDERFEARNSYENSKERAREEQNAAFNENENSREDWDAPLSSAFTKANAVVTKKRSGDYNRSNVDLYKRYKSMQSSGLHGVWGMPGKRRKRTAAAASSATIGSVDVAPSSLTLKSIVASALDDALLAESTSHY